MTSKLSKSWMLGAAVGAVALMGLSPQAQADFSLNLQFQDGSTTMQLSAADVGKVIPIQVWATVTGTDGDNTNEGISFGFFNVISSVTGQGVNGTMNGNVSFNSQFGNGKQIGGTGDLNGDNVPDKGGDLGSLTATADMLKFRSLPLTSGLDGVGTYGEDVANMSAANGKMLPEGFSVRICTLAFTIGSVGSGSTAYSIQVPVTPDNPPPFNWISDAPRVDDGFGGLAFNGKGMVQTPPTLGTTVTFTSGIIPTGNDSNVVLQSPTGTIAYALLAGGVLDVPVSALNDGTDPASPVNVTLDPSASAAYSIGGSGMTINAGATGTALLHIDPAAAGGNAGSATVTVHNATPDLNNPDPDESFSVSVATVGSAAPGEHLLASVTAGGSYAGLMSSVNVGKGTSAVIVTGQAGADTTVDEVWSLATADQIAGNVPFGAGLGPNPQFISEVLDLAGTDGDQIVLAMSYDDTGFVNERLSAEQEHIQIVSFNGEAWVPTTAMNSDGQSHFMGLIDAASTDFAGWQLGAWGVDVNSNIVYAKIDHNSQFAVVPEPATLSLLGLSALGLLARRRRHA